MPLPNPGCDQLVEARQRAADSNVDRVMRPGLGAEITPEHLRLIPEAIMEIAQTQPDQIAMVGVDGELSYADLAEQADRIGAQLAGREVCRGSRVAILMAAAPAMVVAALAVLRLGAAYVPLNPAHPDRRLAEILGDADPVLTIADDASALRPVFADRSVFVPGSGSDAAPLARPPVVAATDSAYVIYTSGSTGQPKGVLVEHAQLAASTAARHRVYPGRAVFLLVSPLAFDSSVAGIWGTLTSGGKLVVAGPDEVRDPDRLIDLIAGHGVSQLLCVPSLYSALLDAAERRGGAELACLETVVTAGEPLAQSLLERHFAILPARVELVNEYGPTEATVWASYRRFDAPGPVSIGGPVPGVRLYVLDDEQNPVPAGTRGELYIGGAGVARGYLGRPAETAQSFLHDPFAGTATARMYRTGDLVRWNDTAALEFVGRRDHQVKIRGHRVELGAVEAALRGLAQVQEAVVVPDREHTGLVGFVVAAEGVSAKQLQAELAERLDPVMVPGRIEALASFPLNGNGKLDRAALQAMVAETTGPDRPLAATATEPGSTADQVTAAWADTLTMTNADVPTDVNFFDLGGNSLAVFALRDNLERHTGIRPSVIALFRHTTVRAQVALIEQGAPAAAQPAAAGDRTFAARRAQLLRERHEQLPGRAAR